MAIINKGMSRRSFLGLTGSVAAVAGLGLTGCGGSSSDEGSASGSTDSANRGGGVITAGSAYAPSSFDPASTGSAVGLGANWHVVEGLYGIDYHDYSTFNELCHRRSQVCGRPPLSRSPSARAPSLRWHRGHR